MYTKYVNHMYPIKSRKSLLYLGLLCNLDLIWFTGSATMLHQRPWEYWGYWSLSWNEVIVLSSQPQSTSHFAQIQGTLDQLRQSGSTWDFGRALRKALDADIQDQGMNPDFGNAPDWLIDLQNCPGTFRELLWFILSAKYCTATIYCRCMHWW